MKITNGYQNRKGEITSYTSLTIIEPNWKYLDRHSFCATSNFLYL